MNFPNIEKLRNLAVYGIGQAVNVVSPLLVMPFLVMHCGEANLGKIGVGFSFALIAIVIVDAGSYINGTREIATSSDDVSTLGRKFGTIYRSRIILLAATLACATLIVLSVPFFRRDALQLFASLLIVTGQAINPTWFFQGIQDFKWISLLNVVSKIIYVAGVFLIVKVPDDYIYVNALWGIGLILSSAAGLVYICRRFGFDLAQGSFKEAMILIRKESSLTISQLFFSFYQYIPIMLVGYFGGDFMAGQYRIIDQIVMIFRTGLQMFFNFIYPEVCSVTARGQKQGLEFWKKANGLNYVFILFLLVLFYWQAPAVLVFLKVSAGNASEMLHFFRFALFIPVVMGITFALKQLVFSFDENKKYIRLTISATMLTLVAMAFALKGFGLIGAFFTMIAVEGLIALGYIVILKDKFIAVAKS